MRTIVLEGPDGAGKTTIAGLLVGRFNAANGCAAAEYWAHHRTLSTDPWLTALSDAGQHAKLARRFLLSPEYNPNVLVIDRWWPSNWARGGPAMRLAQIERESLPRVDAIVWCMADDDTLDRRLESRKETLAPYRFTIRSRYKAMSQFEPLWCGQKVNVDTSADPVAAYEEVAAALELLLRGSL